MSRKIFELDHDGIRDFMRSEDMQTAMKKYAEEAVSKLGNGYECGTYVGRNRVNAEVRAKTAAAARENLKNNSILKAVFGK